MTEEIFTLHEAAERLHMPYRTLRDAVFAGRWPHRYISPRRRLMTEADIRAVLEMTARRPSAEDAPAPGGGRGRKARIKDLIHA